MAEAVKVKTLFQETSDLWRETGFNIDIGGCEETIWVYSWQESYDMQKLYEILSSAKVSDYSDFNWQSLAGFLHDAYETTATYDRMSQWVHDSIYSQLREICGADVQIEIVFTGSGNRVYFRLDGRVYGAFHPLKLIEGLDDCIFEGLYEPCPFKFRELIAPAKVDPAN